jgi:molecular chaperone DnaJ
MTKVSFADAALGTQITVETLDEPVTLKVPAGTQPGTQLRVRGRGVPASGKTHTTAGDLLVKVEVTVPKEMTTEQRAAVEVMRDAFAKSSEEVSS